MCSAYAEDALNVSWTVATHDGVRSLDRGSFTLEREGNRWYSRLSVENFDYRHCGTYSCKVLTEGVWKQLELPLAIEGMFITTSASTQRGIVISLWQ